MKKFALAALAVITIMFNVGCSKSDAEKAAEAAEQAKISIDKEKAKRATFDFIAEERQAAKANVEKSAAAYRADNPRLDDMEIVSHTDSTISASCPGGDGWASVSFLLRDGDVKSRKTGVQKIEVMCSTVDQAVGCYTKDVFDKKKVFAEQNDHCDPNIPSPIPRFK